MQVIDEITRKKYAIQNCKQVVVKHLPGLLVFGYVHDSAPTVDVLFCVDGSLTSYPSVKELLGENLAFSTNRGYYISTIDLPRKALVAETCKKGRGHFPYSFARRYEAIESFNIFDGRQQIVHPEVFEITKYLKYSFGLEFETSMGYVPEDLCFRDGLIPLRDGSIRGLEYSTVVLKGDSGISLLRQQLETLRKYTAFDKECSLHVHLGGFTLEPDVIYRVYYLCKTLEPYIAQLVPVLTFKSSEYKENGKDYCMKLPSFRNFDSLYENLVGRKFFGSLTQPHPNDVMREAKWRIPTRYYWVNLINAICYNVNKTIEFRLLRPTYNFEKILIWIAIFNAIIVFAEKETNLSRYRNISLEDLLESVYPDHIFQYVIEGVYKLNILQINQSSNGDDIGRDISFEDSLFNMK